MADCFISYRRKPSSAVATAIQAKLEAQHKLDAYLDTTRTDGTKVRFPERLMQAISDAPVFVCLLGERDGEHTLQSEWVLKEIQQAYDLRKFCVPVFQESYRPLPDMPAAVDYLLGFDGVHILDEKNIMVDESVRQVADLIRPHVRKRRFPWVALVGVVSILLIGAVFLLTQLNSPEVELTPDTGATDTIEAASEVVVAQYSTETAAAVEATTEEPTQTPSETQTPSPTDTPTVTPTFTPTPNATQIEASITAEMGVIAQEERATQEAAEEATNDALRQAEAGTAQALTETATLWTETPTPNLRATAEARSTATAEQQATEAQETVDAQNTATQEVIDATATATLWTATPSATPTPTASYTPSNTPTPTNTPDPIQLASTPVTRNADWTPVERDFDGVTMVLVPVGSFEMGSTEEEITTAVELCNAARQDGDSCPRSFFEDEVSNGDNTQTFTEPFWIDRTEVTRAQYQKCVDAEACEETPNSDFSSEPDQPINRVTWFQAQTYCEWRGAQLPTEAQWEYAARGPDRLIFPWGDEFVGTLANHCDRNCGDSDWASNYNYVNEENDDGFAITSPVGSFPAGASWVGALDMSGNVWEWTSSLYENYPYDENDGRERDTGSSTDVRRVVRGGSFSHTSYDLRAADRFRFNVDLALNVVGFRCAVLRPPSP